jgi:DNA (cytosine-5)-methyltransferase 1
MNELELFAGAGGGILGSQLVGHRTICAVEFDAYARSVLLARQADGTFPHFPIWDDVRTFDGKLWRGVVDIVSGGFPCQDISVAGRGDGLDGERSGLWGEMARIIGEVRPRYAFIENSPALVSRGLDRVLSDLAALGFDARWTVLGAADVGAHHQRDRIWILANSRGNGRGIGEVQYINRWNATPNAGTDGQEESLAYAYGARCEGYGEGSKRRAEKFSLPSVYGRWAPEPAICRVVDGLADRTHRLKAIGNGQVPQCRAAAWRMLGGC